MQFVALEQRKRLCCFIYLDNNNNTWRPRGPQITGLMSNEPAPPPTHTCMALPLMWWCGANTLSLRPLCFPSTRPYSRPTRQRAARSTTSWTPLSIANVGAVAYTSLAVAVGAGFVAVATNNNLATASHETFAGRDLRCCRCCNHLKS